MRIKFERSHKDEEKKADEPKVKFSFSRIGAKLDAATAAAGPKITGATHVVTAKVASATTTLNQKVEQHQAQKA